MEMEMVVIGMEIEMVEHQQGYHLSRGSNHYLSCKAEKDPKSGKYAKSNRRMKV
jgi:hypothetical protein